MILVVTLGVFGNVWVVFELSTASLWLLAALPLLHARTKVSHVTVRVRALAELTFVSDADAVLMTYLNPNWLPTILRTTQH